MQRQHFGHSWSSFLRLQRNRDSSRARTNELGFELERGNPRAPCTHVAFGDNFPRARKQPSGGLESVLSYTSIPRQNLSRSDRLEFRVHICFTR
jgi:hypothetical protein